MFLRSADRNHCLWLKCRTHMLPRSPAFEMNAHGRTVQGYPALKTVTYHASASLLSRPTWKVTLPRGWLSAAMSKYTTGLTGGPDANSRVAASATEQTFNRFLMCSIFFLAAATLNRTNAGSDCRASSGYGDLAHGRRTRKRAKNRS